MSGLYITTLVTAALSLLSVVTVLLLFTRQTHSAAPPTYTSSRLLRIIMMLIFSDGSVCLLVLVWHFLQSHESDPARLRSMCRVFLPFPIFFFLAGYGFTIMVAWRFQQVSERIKLYEPPFAVVWAVAFALVLPIVVLNSLSSDDYEVSNTITTSYKGSVGEGGWERCCLLKIRLRIWTGLLLI